MRDVKGALQIDKITVGSPTQPYNGYFVLPQNVIITRMQLQAKANVTATVGAGQLFEGTFKELRLEEYAGRRGPRTPRFSVFTSELSQLASFLRRGPTGGIFNDPLPVSGTDSFSFWNIYGQWNTIGRGMRLYLDMLAASTVWLTALTAFTSELRLTLDYKVPETKKELMELMRTTDLKVDRYKGASQTTHQVFLTPGAETRYVTVRPATAARRLTDFALSTEKGQRLISYPAQNENERFRNEWAEWKEQAAQDQNYLYPKIGLSPAVQKRLDFVLDAADIPLVFVTSQEP